MLMREVVNLQSNNFNQVGVTGRSISICIWFDTDLIIKVMKITHISAVIGFSIHVLPGTLLLS
jgi:hypothetical protein